MTWPSLSRLEKILGRIKNFLQGIEKYSHVTLPIALPKLHAIDTVEYEKRSASVRLTEAVERLQLYQEVTNKTAATHGNLRVRFSKSTFGGIAGIIASISLVHFLSIYRLQSETNLGGFLLVTLTDGIWARVWRHPYNEQ